MITQCLTHSSNTLLVNHTSRHISGAFAGLLQVEVLHKGDFRIMPEDSVAKSFPTLEGANSVSKDVWARTYVPWSLDTLLGTITYPTWGRGISSSKVTWWGHVSSQEGKTMIGLDFAMKGWEKYVFCFREIKDSERCLVLLTTHNKPLSL